MKPRAMLRNFALAALFTCLPLASCSRSDSSPGDPPFSAGNALTKEAKEVIQDYARKPIDKARMTQNLGDQRTEAMDQALKEAAGR